MALTQASLSTKIQTEIIALYGVADDSSRLKDFCDAIAKAVVDEIQANGTVPAGIPVTTSAGSGSTSGPGTIV